MIDDQQTTPVRDDAPTCEALTDYDRGHLKTYLRLLDAATAGATSDDMCHLILGIDPQSDPGRARRTLAGHLQRARWMVEAGYRELANATSESRDTGPTSEIDQTQ
jgi:hypothetical protein